MRILIAEDDLTSRNVLSSILKKAGHEVLETANGAEAWEELQRPNAPRLLILDWMMPEVDGPELIRMVRSVESDHSHYMVLLTTKGDKEDIIRGLQSGANDYVGKPFHSGELLARVEVGRRMIEMQDALIESRELLARVAAYDDLTNMLNRRAALEHLRGELARAKRQRSCLAVGICDVDHFKKVNDKYGHGTGDDVLLGFSRILHENIREYDCVGRIGGEEFLLIVPVETKSVDIAAFERLRKFISESRIETRSGELTVTASFGVAFTDGQDSVDDILEIADGALYRAKAGGRNCVCVDGRFRLQKRMTTYAGNEATLNSNGID